MLFRTELSLNTHSGISI